MREQLAIDGGKPVRERPMELRAFVDQREYDLVKQVLDRGILSEFRAGPMARELEARFAAYHDCQFGVAVNSGTSALHLAVASLGIGPGDEVIVPPFTYVSTATVVLQQYAVPVFADIDPITFCVSPDSVEAAITSRTKAIIVVHLFGHPADLVVLRDVATRHGLALIEDCAQAHGARYCGQRVGAWGEVGCFSFYQSKNMTTGEGGMLVTNNEVLLRRARLLKECGNPRDAAGWYYHVEIGYNYQMSDLQAAVGIAQLEKLEMMSVLRRRHAHLYTENLAGLGLALPQEIGEIEHVYHLYPILLPPGYAAQRDWFVQALKAENVLAGATYPQSLHQNPLFVSIAKGGFPLLGPVEYSDEWLPVTLDVASRIVTLRTDPCLTEQDILDTCHAIERVWTHMVAEHEV
jgi:perosamine synthetase